MTGVKMGDRLVQIGCADAGRLAAVAGRVGLSGRALAVVPAESVAARVRHAAARAGVLVEIEIASPRRCRLKTAVRSGVVDDTADSSATCVRKAKSPRFREIDRILRPGGRVVFIGTSPRGGLAGCSHARRTTRPLVASGQASALLKADGFLSVRQLADRDAWYLWRRCADRATRRRRKGRAARMLMAHEAVRPMAKGLPTHWTCGDAFNRPRVRL